MLKLFTKKDELIEELEDEMEIYEDELQEDGYIEVELFSGYHAKKGFDYDVIIRLYEEEDSEVQDFHYFSYTVDQEEDANKRIEEVESFIKEKGYKVERTFRG